MLRTTAYFRAQILSRLGALAPLLVLVACGGGQMPMLGEGPAKAGPMAGAGDQPLRSSMGAGDAASAITLSKPQAVAASTLGGSTELLWHNASTGQTVSWAMSGVTASNTSTLLQAPNWKFSRSADLNGDGQQDLIWENSVTQQHVAWLMNGGQTLQSTVLLQLPGWKIAHSADFNGDGKADLLWHNATTGQTVAWLMNGTSAQASQVLLTSPVWQVTHVADLNGDGKADLIWRNSQTGQTAAWLMNGTNMLASGSLLDLSAWRVSHVGDLDGDGRDDLVWLNAGTGQTVLWLMNGLASSSSTLLFTHPSWRVSRVADLDGDGKADLLWSHAGTGEVAGWLMNGAVIRGNAVLLANASWQLAQTTDLNGDGRQDLIWRHASNGQTVAWLMNGLTAVSQSTLLTLPAWEVVGQRAVAPAPAVVSWPVTRSAESLIWFTRAGSPIQLAAHNGAGQLLTFSVAGANGRGYALRFADGTDLRVGAAASGPGQIGDSVAYQGHTVQVLTWSADGRPVGVRVRSRSGTVLDLELPASLRSSSVAEPGPTRRALNADGGFTDTCPQLQQGDEDLPVGNDAASDRVILNAGCRLGPDTLLRGHPTQMFLSNELDWIASRAESVSAGFTKAFKQDLPAAWRASGDFLDRVAGKFQQAAQDAGGAVDRSLRHGIRLSNQLLPASTREDLLDWLAADLLKLKADTAAEGLTRLDAARLARPSNLYTPQPAPILPPPSPAIQRYECVDTGFDKGCYARLTTGERLKNGEWRGFCTGNDNKPSSVPRSVENFRPDIANRSWLPVGLQVSYNCSTGKLDESYTTNAAGRYNGNRITYYSTTDASNGLVRTLVPYDNGLISGVVKRFDFDVATKNTWLREETSYLADVMIDSNQYTVSCVYPSGSATCQRTYYRSSYIKYGFLDGVFRTLSTTNFCPNGDIRTISTLQPDLRYLVEKRNEFCT